MRSSRLLEDELLLGMVQADTRRAHLTIENLVPLIPRVSLEAASKVLGLDLKKPGLHVFVSSSLFS